MRCAKCNYENPADALFCMKCGAKVEHRCASCNTLNPNDANFCRKCGAPLGTNEAASAPKRARAKAPRVEVTPERQIPDTPVGERKTVTVLFADIKGSMELIEDLDPEEARAIVDPALKLMMEAVQRYGGYVAQSTGDGIFALFGAPAAYEDHPQRALLSALRMQQELKRYSARTRAEGRLPIQVRVGINTGEVVVRAIQTGEGRAEYAPVGHSTGIAARMQALAPIGSIATTEQVRKLCEGYFAFAALGPTKVKGISEPVNVYEVTGLGPLRTRLQRSAIRGYTKFVGREREMEALNHAAELAKGGRGQIVGVVADPGVGKSRLFHEFKGTSLFGWMLLEAVSFSHDKAAAYVPVVDLFSQYFDIEVEDDARKRREKVAGKIAILDRALEDTLPYLYGLLGLIEGNDPLAGMDAPIRRQRTLDALKRILLRESLNQPLMIIFEDLHWIDDETQAFLNLLADSIGTARLLLLVNYRPEYAHQWGSKTYYTQLRLDPLGSESAGEMFDALLGMSVPSTDGSVAVLRRLIIEKSEGTPLFMEEIVQALVEEGALVRNGAVRLTRSVDTLKIPPTVQAILASRIDRLPAGDKELLQTLAVIGSEFPLELVRKTVQLSSDQLDHSLGRLQAGEFIYEQPAMGDVQYTFKHALTYDEAYKSLLTERRKLLHERTALAIEALYSQRLEDHYADLARHYRETTNTNKAVEYSERAGQQAAQRSAYGESFSHLSAGLELLKTLPDNLERTRRELVLQIALAQSMGMTHGLVRPEVGRALLRARELCQLVGERPELVTVLIGLMIHNMLQLRLRLARKLGEELLAMTESSGNLGVRGSVQGQLGMVSTLMGNFNEARQYFDRSVTASDISHARKPDTSLMLGHTAIGPFYEAAFYPAFRALPLWALGYSDQALQSSHYVLTEAKKLSRPALLANAEGNTAMIHLFLHDPLTAQQHAETAIAIAVEHAIPFELAFATIFRGGALGAQGRVSEGVAEMHRGIALGEAAGFARRPRWFALLAELEALNKGPEEGLKTLRKGFALLENSEERIFEAELHRINGELLYILDVANASTAENCFRRAIEIARQQAARTLELRASMSLARLLAKHGRRDEARAMLAEIYNWFTEGFDTADLKDGKALLEELSA